MINITNYEQSVLLSIEQIAAVAGRLPGVVIIHNLYGSVVWMSEIGLNLLGISQEEVSKLSADEYYNTFFNSEDAKDYVPKILGLLERNNDNEFCTYFQQVRYKGESEWTWHSSSCKIFARDNQGKPTHTITMAFPFDSMHHMQAKAERLLNENNFLRKYYKNFSTLSEREREVLKLLAKGLSTSESAELLFIANNTIETHRKNIKKKLDTNSYFELCEYARAFDLI